MVRNSDAMSLRYADTSLPELLGRFSLQHYANQASAMQTKPPLCYADRASAMQTRASTIQHTFLNLGFYVIEKF